MESRGSTDRAAIRAMVEEFWRSFLSLAQTPEISTQLIVRFNARMQATAATMEPEKAAMFLQIVEEEREILFNEYERSPDALKTRLGLQPATIHPDIPQSLDPASIRAVAQSDYEVAREMARAPGATLTGTGAQIDAEIARRLRDMSRG